MVREEGESPAGEGPELGHHPWKTVGMHNSGRSLTWGGHGGKGSETNPRVTRVPLILLLGGMPGGTRGLKASSYTGEDGVFERRVGVFF